MAGDSNPDVVPAERVWIWFTVPDVGRENLLMVLVNDPDSDGVVYRPLLALDADTANGQALIASAAAQELGCQVVLREFECRTVTPLGGDLG